MNEPSDIARKWVAIWEQAKQPLSECFQSGIDEATAELRGRAETAETLVACLQKDYAELRSLIGKLSEQRPNRIQKSDQCLSADSQRSHFNTRCQEREREMNLSPCPWCGETPEITKHFNEPMWMLLHRCKIVGPIKFDFTSDFAGLFRTWNTRHPQPAGGDAKKESAK